MLRRVIMVALVGLAVVGHSACGSEDPLVGTWRQTGVLLDDGTVQPAPVSQAVVLEIRGGGKALVAPQGAHVDGTPFTWDLSDDGKLQLKAQPGWDVRTVYELRYEIDGDSLTTDWIDFGGRRVFERQ